MSVLLEPSTSQQVRAKLRPHRERPLVRSMLTLAFDYALLAGFSVAGLKSRNLPTKVACGLLAGTMVGRLFVIGHDACHGSFSKYRAVNRIVGRLAFLPSLTSYSAWALGHNEQHHPFTNLVTHDHVWAPFSKASFDELPWWRQSLERIYRTPLGHGLYYCVEDWWKHYFFRRTKIAGYWDFALVAGTCAAVAFAIALFAKRRGESVAISVGCSMVLPFAAWNASMGFIIFQQHTSADIPWYDDYEAWRKTTSALDGVQRVLFPAFLNTVFHNIMEHHAHHADPSISLHALPRAQAALEAAFPDRAKVVPFTVRGFLETARKCKLYDYEAHRWCDFDGNYTTESLA